MFRSFLREVSFPRLVTAHLCMRSLRGSLGRATVISSPWLKVDFFLLFVEGGVSSI